MDMSEEQKVVLCCANFYERKYYLNPAFEKLPQSIKEELKIGNHIGELLDFYESL